jgi:hypothetical protein
VVDCWKLISVFQFLGKMTDRLFSLPQSQLFGGIVTGVVKLSFVSALQCHKDKKM